MAFMRFTFFLSFLSTGLSLGGGDILCALHQFNETCILFISLQGFFGNISYSYEIPFHVLGLIYIPNLKRNIFSKIYFIFATK